MVSILIINLLHSPVFQQQRTMNVYFVTTQKQYCEIMNTLTTRLSS